MGDGDSAVIGDLGEKVLCGFGVSVLKRARIQQRIVGLGEFAVQDAEI